MSMEQFFQQIVYSAANEDPMSEREALALDRGDRVLCITGSGARPLDLLIDGPGAIVSLDFNARQNHLLELKMAAIARYEHRECLEFLGVYPGERRREQLVELEEDLSPQARAYWRSEPQAIRDGVIYMGVWERYMRRVKGMMPRRALLHRLVTADTLAEQRELWRQWRGWQFDLGMRVLGWRWVWRTILREPGIEFVPNGYDITGHLVRSFERAATERLLRTNPYMNLMIGDGYTDDAMPLHLRPEHFDQIKANLSTVRIVTGSLVEHLRGNPSTYTAFSVSDFSSYADPKSYHEVWSAIIDAAVDGARVCERFFMVPYEPDQLFAGVIERDRAMERRLADQDHTFIYSFNCATLRTTHGDRGGSGR